MQFKFEEALKRLEEITEQLESGELALDESLKLYEEGMKLKDQCNKYLKKAEGKIYKIQQSNDKDIIIEEVQEESILNNDLFGKNY